MVAEVGRGCGSTALAVSGVALQLCGGRGYGTRPAIERYFRDARAGTFTVGSTEGRRDGLGNTILGLD